MIQKGLIHRKTKQPNSAQEHTVQRTLHWLSLLRGTKVNLKQKSSVSVTSTVADYSSQLPLITCHIVTLRKTKKYAGSLSRTKKKSGRGTETLYHQTLTRPLDAAAMTVPACPISALPATNVCYILTFDSMFVVDFKS